LVKNERKVCSESVLFSHINKMMNFSEVSMYGYKPDAKSDRIIPYTEENCK